MELKKQLESVDPNKSEHHWCRFCKEYQGAEPRIRQRETGIVYQHDPRHVDVLVESLGLEHGNTVQPPIVDDVKHENPVRLDAGQISKYRSHVARCLFLSEGSGHNIRHGRVVPENVRSLGTQLHQIEAARSEPEGRDSMEPSVRIPERDFIGDSFLRVRLGLSQVQESRSQDDTF